MKLIIALLAVTLLASCAPRFDKQVNYISRVFVGELGSKSGKAFNEYTKERINICFKGSRGDVECFENIQSGQMLNLKTNSKSLSLHSIDLIQNGQEYKYAFKKQSKTTSVELAEYEEAVYLGRILVNVTHDKDTAQPEINLFSTCGAIKKDMDALVKLKAFGDANKVKPKCLALGATAGKGKNAVTLMIVMPPR